MHEHDPLLPPARHMKRGAQGKRAVVATNEVRVRPSADAAYQRKRAIALCISALIVGAIPALILALVMLG